MQKTRIVLVEDDQILGKVLYEELTEAGYEITQAFDGEDGLKMIRQKMPDLVLLDIVMPKKNGFEVLEALKEAPDTKRIPIIVLTMSGGDEEIKKGLRLGANDYIVKSQHAVAEIVEKVKDFFGKESHPEGVSPSA